MTPEKKNVKEISTFKTYIKGGKQSTKKQQADEKASMRRELNELNDALFKAKKITKPVYNENINIIFKSNTHITTIAKKLEVLRAIKFDNQKRVTKKQVKEIKKNIKADNEAIYTVFMKLRISVDQGEFEPGVDSVQALEQNGIYLMKISNKQVKYSLDNRNFTLKIEGKSNIKNELKRCLDFEMGRPYVLKAEVMQIIINKEQLSTDVYRWTGAKIQKYHGRHQYEGVKYMRAWEGVSCFKYHMMNEDMNNETKFECVPSAFMKMYGDRSQKGFIARIAKGGMDYIKTCLDSYDDNGLYYGVDIEKEGFKGYTSEHILKFCNEHKIRCYGFDWKMNLFITNKNSGVSFSNNYTPAFVFKLNDEHIYLINDAEARQRLLKNNDGSDIFSLIAKEKEKKNTEAAHVVDIPVEDWATYEKTNIYITQQRAVHNQFYKFICEHNVYNNKKLKMNEKDGIVKFGYQSNTIIYNPDYHKVIKTIETLNNRERVSHKYIFSGQKLDTLAKELLEKEFGSISQSTMNKKGDEIFQSEFIRNCQFNGWFSKPASKNLSSYDYNKHYTSCLLGDENKFGFPIYNIFDEVEPFHMRNPIKCGFYFVETENFFPFRGNGWYDADLVYYGIKENIINRSQIRFQYCSSFELKPKHFKKFVIEVYEYFESPKDAINKFIGCWGHDFKNKNEHHFTSEYKNVLAELESNKEAKIKYVYAAEFENEANQKQIDIDDVDINTFITDKRPVCYHVYNDTRIKSFQNSLPLFYKIYNVSAIKMHQMAKNVGGIVRGVFTDTIIFENAENKPECNKDLCGGIRESKIYEFTKCMSTDPREGTYKFEQPKIKAITEFKLEDGKGCFITGLAGTGKSYKTNQLKASLQPSQYVCCTPTHKSALIVNGQTIYNVFNINPHDHTYIKGTVEKLKKNGLQWVFIDEISMINSKCWAVLRDIKKVYKFKFILVGDFGQLDPVEEKVYDVLHSDVFAELCDFQKMELTKNWRAEKDPEFKLFIDDLIKVREGRDIDFKTYNNKECRKSIAWTNMTRKIVNGRWMLKEAQGKKCYLLNEKTVFAGLPIISTKTVEVGKKLNEQTQLVFNNEEFVVASIDEETITINNDRATIKISHPEFKIFDLAYCITVHKSQGSTYDFEYTIYDYNYKHFGSKLLYTAMSRATQRSNINFVATHYKVQTGYIYKITNMNTGKIYVGSTTRADLNERFKEHKQATDTAPLHVDMRMHDNWEIALVKSIQYIDIEQLQIAESCAMIEHDSLNNGYNTQLAISIDRFYDVPMSDSNKVRAPLEVVQVEKEIEIPCTPVQQCSTKCKCGLEKVNICVCHQPNYKECFGNLFCSCCDKWKCRCH